MYKKAGIVVGITIWVVAIFLYLGYNIFTKENDKVVVQQDTVKDKRSDENVNEGNKKDRIKEVKEVNDSIKGSLFLIDDGSISNGYVEEDDFVVVDKNYVLNKSKEGNIILPCVTLFNDKKGLKIENFFTDTVYNNLSIGDKIRARYKVITNKSGAKFFMIISLEKVI